MKVRVIVSSLNVQNHMLYFLCISKEMLLTNNSIRNPKSLILIVNSYSGADNLLVYVLIAFLFYITNLDAMHSDSSPNCFSVI